PALPLDTHSLPLQIGGGFVAHNVLYLLIVGERGGILVILKVSPMVSIKQQLFATLRDIRLLGPPARFHHGIGKSPRGDLKLTPITGFYAGSERREKREASGLMGLS